MKIAIMWFLIYAFVDLSIFGGVYEYEKAGADSSRVQHESQFEIRHVDISRLVIMQLSQSS